MSRLAFAVLLAVFCASAEPHPWGGQQQGWGGTPQQRSVGRQDSYAQGASSERRQGYVPYGPQQRPGQSSGFGQPSRLGNQQLQPSASNAFGRSTGGWQNDQGYGQRSNQGAGIGKSNRGGQEQGWGQQSQQRSNQWADSITNKNYGQQGRSAEGPIQSRGSGNYERKGYKWMTDAANVEHYFDVPRRY
ncbi:uncharacterized protein LOC132202510 [Neocloeon triangulifer]|uniref:uncharacterized protein LOC132202510 n=1 Tax=Neocloeon triangulifer TaxID=2078957 RepID=UPI00286ED81D|nr:uncharacterized protein LOC132202510 [Neocloeon triangulifer]